MITIVETDHTLVETFHTLLGESSTVVADLDELDEHLALSPDEYAVVLGPSVDLTLATTFAGHIRVTRPSLGVILVRHRVDNLVLGEALRAGMREVVESRDLTGLTDAVRRAYGVWQAMEGAHDDDGKSRVRPNGRLVTVFSTKGGVGKTTIATNLAVALAKAEHGVCLVDLDVASGDVGLLLQLFPTRSLADLNSLRGGLDPAGIESLITKHAQSKLSVISAPLHVDPKNPVPADTVNELLGLLKGMFEYVVVDTSGTFDDDYALHALDNSDVLLLVGTLDIPALKSLKVATDTLELLNIPRPHWRLVLNRADSKVGLSTKEFEQALDLEITTPIASSREVPASVNRGEPIVLASPKHPVSQGIEALAQQLTGARPQPATKQAAGEAAKNGRSHASEPRRSLLRRKVRQA